MTTECDCKNGANFIKHCQLHKAAGEMYAALVMLFKEELGDFIYEIRDNELKGWEGPRVMNWGKAVTKAKAAMAVVEGP